MLFQFDIRIYSLLTINIQNGAYANAILKDMGITSASFADKTSRGCGIVMGYE